LELTQLSLQLLKYQQTTSKFEGLALLIAYLQETIHRRATNDLNISWDQIDLVLHFFIYIFIFLSIYIFILFIDIFIEAVNLTNKIRSLISVFIDLLFQSSTGEKGNK